MTLSGHRNNNLNMNAAFRHGISHNRSQLQHITTLIESGAIRPVVNKIFPFTAISEALAYVENGWAKGEVVIKVA
jgi:NADPH:quinone reductase-like Zn-dependent oxidoreductase